MSRVDHYFVKIKLMVVDSTVSDEDKPPLAVGDYFIESVGRFPYLGSLISDDKRIDAEVERRIANASKACGALCSMPFFLSIETKWLVHRACVLSVLLFGSTVSVGCPWAAEEVKQFSS